MSSPTTISVAIITLNEEANLLDLLPRLGWADEVVVVDSHSQDATIQVARRYGARVAVRAFDNFANQRNAALDLARGDWVLFIDADERPSGQLVAEIRRRIVTCAEHGFRVPIKSSIFGRRFRFCGTQDDQPLRLVGRNSGRWTGRVHEVFRCRGAIAAMQGHLDHATLPDLRAFRSKVQRYTTLEAEARVAAGRPPKWPDAWWRPPREVFRRLIWKHGWLDGPRGWVFCLLSGWSEWVLANKHRRLWRAAKNEQSCEACGAL